VSVCSVSRQGVALSIVVVTLSISLSLLSQADSIAVGTWMQSSVLLLVDALTGYDGSSFGEHQTSLIRALV
jgi:hypothetical protein